MRSIVKIPIDFNEMIDSDLALLSKTDLVKDAQGNSIILEEGMKAWVYEEDLDELGKRDDLVAIGTVESNSSGVFKVCKWNVRIDKNGIRNESEL